MPRKHWPAAPASSRVNPLLHRPRSTRLRYRTPDMWPSPTSAGAGSPANTVVAATVNAQKILASRPGLFAGKPAPTTAEVHAPPVSNHRCVAITNPAGVQTPPVRNHDMWPSPTIVGAGSPANTVVAATVNAQKTLASSPGLFAGKPAPTTAEVHTPPVPKHRYVATTNQ